MKTTRHSFNRMTQMKTKKRKKYEESIDFERYLSLFPQNKKKHISTQISNF
jgi:hypothetical protein